MRDERNPKNVCGEARPNPNVKSLQKENDSTTSFFLPFECILSPARLVQLLASR